MKKSKKYLISTVLVAGMLLSASSAEAFSFSDIWKTAKNIAAPIAKTVIDVASNKGVQDMGFNLASMALGMI